MENWVITLISLVGSAIITTTITTVVGILIKKFVTKESNKTEELNKLRDEHNAREMQEKIRSEIKPLIDSIEEVNIKVNQIGEGTLSTLRNDILTCYYRCREKGYRNDYDTQNLNDLYNAYAQLHGNSFISDVMKRFSDLPTKEEYEEKKKKAKKVLNEDN